MTSPTGFRAFSIKRMLFIVLALAVPYLALQLWLDLRTAGREPPELFASVLTVVAILAGVGVIWMLQRTVQAATDTLARHAGRIAAGDFQARLALDGDGSDSEFGVLADAMNRMSQAIDDSTADLRAQAARDGLTGLANGAHLEFALNQELKRLQRHGGTVCVAMLDIDGFSRINDKYGHDGGDEVLREFARVLRLHTRSSDLAARYSGQAFALILYDANISSISGRLESIRVAIAGMDVHFGGKQLPRITISLGVAEALRHGETAGEVLNAADDAMRQAKDSGGNRTKVFTTLK